MCVWNQPCQKTSPSHNKQKQYFHPSHKTNMSTNDNSMQEDQFQHSNSSYSSLGAGSVGSFFIPGITAKARCLSSSDTILQMTDDSSTSDDGPSSSRRRIMIPPPPTTTGEASPSTGGDRSSRRKKDERFSKMMEELTAARKEADEARHAALLVKERFENEASSAAHCLYNDPIFDELRRFCTKASWDDLCLWECCWDVISLPWNVQ